METLTTTEITPASVAAMSNRELDAALALLCGWQVYRSKHGHYEISTSDGGHLTAWWPYPGDYDAVTGERNPDRNWWDDCPELPHYSTDPAAAAEAVAAVLALGYFITVQGSIRGWWVEVVRERSDNLIAFQAKATTEPRAKTECCTLALAATQRST